MDCTIVHYAAVGRMFKCTHCFSDVRCQFRSRLAGTCRGLLPRASGRSESIDLLDEDFFCLESRIPDFSEGSHA